MKRKITLKQIAKELDVSISTVSKALETVLKLVRIQGKKYRLLLNFIITDQII